MLKPSKGDTKSTSRDQVFRVGRIEELATKIRQAATQLPDRCCALIRPTAAALPLSKAVTSSQRQELSAAATFQATHDGCKAQDQR